jgi:hypothetical protein
MNCVDCGQFSTYDTGGHEVNSNSCEHCLVEEYLR